MTLARPLQPTVAMRLILSFVSVLVLVVGCNAGSTNPPGGGADAGAGAADAASGNALGQTCASATDCPANHKCVILQSGNPNLGYCSPMCSVDSDCMGGYTGPSTGTPTCFVPNQPNVCAILCNVEADCPSGLTCFITGGPVNVCTTPQ